MNGWRNGKVFSNLSLKAEDNSAKRSVIKDASIRSYLRVGSYMLPSRGRIWSCRRRQTEVR